jgi:NAD(P)H-flavin reductase
MGGAPGHPLAPTPSRVRRVARESHDTFTLEIDADPRPAYAPGQFAMLYAFGVGEVPISYSGNPNESESLVHTTREVGAVTRALGRLRRGDTVGIRGPFGHGWPLESAVGLDVVMVAGGIGLAPLRPALFSIAARRGEFGQVVLLCGARSPVDLLFRRDLDRWRAEAHVDVRVTVDRGTRTWPGSVGVVTALVPRAPIDPRRALALICGPEIMIRFAAATLRARGVPAERIFVSLERNMKCAVALCGRCQLGPTFVCRDGPVFPWDRAERLLEVREL